MEIKKGTVIESANETGTVIKIFTRRNYPFDKIVKINWRYSGIQDISMEEIEEALDDGAFTIRNIR